MSNSRKLRVLPGPGGAFAQRLGCGHLGVPGRIVSDADSPGMSRCAACSGELETVHEKMTGRYA